MLVRDRTTDVHRASDRIEHEEWVERLERAAGELDLDEAATTTAVDFFLSEVPDSDRSKPAAVAAALYAAALVSGDERSQSSVANAVGVSRLAVQKRWRGLLDSAGFDVPEW